jgi:hypothetical protein
VCPAVGGWVASDGRLFASSGPVARDLGEILGVLAADGWELTSAGDDRMDVRRPVRSTGAR